ncbi:hypothetical protein [Motilimonas sp. KMU-193]|uniref:HD domain-containing protein n=1 Tax=Motilimonas sp. KMU-193 TaxID=3388668 RepID=UPI00396B1105
MNQTRWLNLMQAMGFPPSIGCYQALEKAYSQPHRYYHTVKHIDAMLKHFDSVKLLAEQSAELELAIWFHDAIYNIPSSRNELDSALWAKEFVLTNQYDEAGAKRIFDLIMATQQHEKSSLIDANIIVDTDLAILGSSPATYAEFEQNIRREYHMVPEDIYRAKRAEILEHFLAQGSIYKLDSFISQYESAARENISRAIDSLKTNQH